MVDACKLGHCGPYDAPECDFMVWLDLIQNINLATGLRLILVDGVGVKGCCRLSQVI